MTEAELEASIAADPDWADVSADWWRDAVPVFVGPGTRRLALSLPPDLVSWLESKGGAMAAEAVIALRAAMHAERERDPPPP